MCFATPVSQITYNLLKIIMTLSTAMHDWDQDTRPLSTTTASMIFFRGQLHGDFRGQKGISTVRRQKGQRFGGSGKNKMAVPLEPGYYPSTVFRLPERR
ncbi:MAG: hypothetical protein ACTHNW_19515 [Mucilaginibacter sp.]